MVYCEPPFHHHLFQVAIAQGITQVPPDTQEDDIGLEMTLLKGVTGVHGRGRLGEL